MNMAGATQRLPCIKIKPPGYHVQGSYYKMDKEDIHSVSWGFCGKDCYLPTYQPNTGVIRMKANINILSETACDTFLNISMELQPQVSFLPSF